MTAVMDDIDLDWVVFSDRDHDRACETKREPCGRVAVYKVLWAPDSSVSADQQDLCCDTTLYCIEHYEAMRQPGLIYCARCWDRMGKRRFKRMSYSEFIRK